MDKDKMAHYYNRYSDYEPLAVRQWTDELGQARYTWGEDETGDADDMAVWKPALAGRYFCIILEDTFLYTRKLAQAEADMIIKALRKSPAFTGESEG